MKKCQKDCPELQFMKVEKYHQIHYPKEAVVVVIFNENDDILFIHNRRYTVGHLEWEIPAGKIEEGESIEEATIREAKEETGCDLKDIKFLCSQNPSNGTKDGVSILAILYALQFYPFEK